ncbi:MAG: cohesin domain-containing protein [Anaerolineales bacterium]|nr:MAG: cohesin domain-containing protein [Anaerolineales bacterium]
MKKVVPLFIVIFSLFIIVPVRAQSPETIWITASTDSFKTGETLVVTVHAVSATPIQGFTVQLSYDPACLKPLNAASSIPTMNGLLLPQTAGLADATFASSTPQMANGVLGEVRFVTLGACQTNVTLASAALAIKNEAGIAAPLGGMTVEAKEIPLSISGEQANPQDLPLLGTPLPLDVASASPAFFSLSREMVIVLVILGVFIFIGLFIFIRILRGSHK